MTRSIRVHPSRAVTVTVGQAPLVLPVIRIVCPVPNSSRRPWSQTRMEVAGPGQVLRVLVGLVSSDVTCCLGPLRYLTSSSQHTRRTECLNVKASNVRMASLSAQMMVPGRPWRMTRIQTRIWHVHPTASYHQRGMLLRLGYCGVLRAGVPPATWWSTRVLVTRSEATVGRWMGAARTTRRSGRRRLSGMLAEHSLIG